MRLRSSTGDTGHFNINEPAKYKKSQLWKVVRSASLIFIVASIAIYYYYTTFIKISGIAIISANKITLTSPGQAIVEDMLNLNDFEDVKEGQKIAQLGIHVSDIIGLNRDMYNFQEKILFLEEKMETLDASTNQGYLSFKQKLRDLEHQVTATKLEIKSLEADETNMHELYKISQEEQVNAAKLYELEVINLTQLKKFQKESIESKNDWQSVKRKITYHNDIITQIEKRSEALKIDQDELRKRNNESIAKLKMRKEFVEKQLNEYKEFSAGGNKNVTVYSPINGRILENHIKPGDSLAPEDPIVTLYRPNFMELRAYVEERFMDRIKVGGTAVVSMFNNSFESKITHIRKMIVQSPKELRGRKLVPEDRYYFSIELDTANMPDGLFPGKTGKVIFKE